MKIIRNKVFLVCSILFLILAVSGIGIFTYSYLTDRTDNSESITAGTVDIVLDTTAEDKSDSIGIDFTDNEGKDILNPGDARQASFSVENIGNKSVDIRTTIYLTSTVPFDVYSEQAELELYNKEDVELIDGKGYQPKDGAKPLEVREFTPDRLSIVYSIPEYVLNGNMDLEEKEIEDRVTTDTHIYDYVLLVKRDASNDFQNVNVKMTVLVEAKQHRNTSAGWHLITKESIQIGDSTVDVVDKYKKGVTE